MNQNQKSRREFFKDAAKLFSVVTVAPIILGSLFSSVSNGEERRRGGQAPAAGGAPPMVDPKDNTAKAVKYVENFKKAPEAKGNKCSTCILYAKTSMKDGKEVGSCGIFPGKNVYSDAWCASWAKKP